MLSLGSLIYSTCQPMGLPQNSCFQGSSLAYQLRAKLFQISRCSFSTSLSITPCSSSWYGLVRAVSTGWTTPKGEKETGVRERKGRVCVAGSESGYQFGITSTAQQRLSRVSERRQFPFQTGDARE